MINFNKTYPGPIGEDNISGLKQNLYLARSDWFASIQTPSNLPNQTVAFDPTKDVESVTIATDHTFVSGKGFIPVYSTQDTGEFDIPASKNYDQSGAMAMVKFFVPGHRTKDVAMMRWAQNFNWIGLAQDVDGTYYQLGQKDLWLKLSAGFATKTLTGDRKGFSYEGKFFTIAPLIYTGVVTLYP